MKYKNNEHFAPILEKSDLRTRSLLFIEIYIINEIIMNVDATIIISIKYD